MQPLKYFPENRLTSTSKLFTCKSVSLKLFLEALVKTFKVSQEHSNIKSLCPVSYPEIKV